MQKIEEIEKIRKEFNQKLNDLKMQQDRILAEYLSELEKIKMQEIRDNLKQS